MARRRNYWDNESDSMGLESLVTGRRAGRGWGTAMRSPGRGTRFWRPSEALASQPFFGFPGGQTAWERFRGTGEMPTNAATGRPFDFAPEVRDFYHRLPPQESALGSTSGLIDVAPTGTLTPAPYVPPPVDNSPYQPGGEAITYQQNRPTGALEALVAAPPIQLRGWNRSPR